MSTRKFSMLDCTYDVEDVLETIVDAQGLAGLLDALASVGWAKAEHLRSNWQDNSTARAWEKATVRIQTLAESTAITNISPDRQHETV